MSTRNENITMINIIKRMEKTIMENLNINYKGNMCENCTKCGICLDFGNYELIEDELIEDVKEFNGDIFVISDGKFIQGLTANEFIVYYGFLGISRHDNNGKHYIYKDDLNWSELEQELQLSGRKKDSIMTRKSIKQNFDELVKKKVFTHVTLDNGDEVYYIMQTKGFKFTRMPADTFKKFQKTLSGNALKTYIFIKGNMDNVKANGKEILYMNRKTIAEAIGLRNRKGEVEKKQLDMVGMIINTLYGFELLDMALSTKVVNGHLVGRYEIYGVKTELKDLKNSKPKLKM